MTTAAASTGLESSKHPAWTVDPFPGATPEAVARLRSVLAEIGFTEREICERAGVATIYDLANGQAPDSPMRTAGDACAVATRLFVLGAEEPWTTVRAAFAGLPLEVFTELGLLATPPADPLSCVSSLALYPMEGLYVASDRHGDLSAVATGIPEDFVYSALTESARQFVA